jgi:hypothetical protein
MPLVLSTEPETERPQIITWDTELEEDIACAEKKIEALCAQGFIIDYKKSIEGQVRLEPPPLPPNTGLMRILCENGDDRMTWDRTVGQEVKDAFKKFKELINKGHVAYAARPDGKKGRKLEEFDPNAEEVIMVPHTRPG